MNSIRLLSWFLVVSTACITVVAWTKLGFWYAFGYIVYVIVVAIWLAHRDVSRELDTTTFVLTGSTNPYLVDRNQHILPYIPGEPGTITREQYQHLMDAHLQQFYGDEAKNYRQITREKMQQRLEKRTDTRHPPLTNDQMNLLDRMWTNPTGGTDIPEAD